MTICFFFVPPVGGIGSKQHTGSSNRGCARLGGGAVAPPLGVAKEKVTVLVVLVFFMCAPLRREARLKDCFLTIQMFQSPYCGPEWALGLLLRIPPVG